MQTKRIFTMLTLVTLGTLIALNLISFITKQTTIASTTEQMQLTMPTLIAHAGGEINSQKNTNSLEALNLSIKKGFNFIELDFSWTKDKELVLIHDWGKTVKQLFEADSKQYTLNEFKQLKMKNGLTQLSLNDLTQWMNKHPDVHIATDTKDNTIDALTMIKNKYPNLKDNFIPQIYFFKEYLVVKKLGYKNIILTMYRSKYLDSEIIDFIDNNDVIAITMPITRAITELPIRLKAKDIPSYTHTINNHSLLKNLLKNGLTGIYTDSLIP